MNSIILSQPILIVAALTSGILTILIRLVPGECLKESVRVCMFLAACICILTVLLLTLVGGGSQEEIACYLLCLMACLLSADRFGKGGGA